MIRTFHAMGQGAFYTEEFEGFTVVYDCGTANGVDLIQREIRNAFQEGDWISALFVSHLGGGIEGHFPYLVIQRQLPGLGYYPPHKPFCTDTLPPMSVLA